MSSSVTRTTVEAVTRVLAKLDLPPILAGDTVPAIVREMLLELPDVSLRRGGAQFYSENGEPIDLEPRETMRRVAEIRNRPGGEIRATLHSNRRVPILVATAYLGVDISHFGPLPLVWETLVFVGDKGLPLPYLLEPIRYATRAAAHSGHQAVVDALAQSVVRAR